MSDYIKSVLDLSRSGLGAIYFDGDLGDLVVGKSLFSTELPSGFGNLKDFQAKPGVYLFVNSAGESYIGSTIDLESRLNSQHRLRGLNPKQTYRHRSLYGIVIERGWEDFNLHILAVVRHHTNLFLALSFDVPTQEEMAALSILDRYELMVVEQGYIDIIEPSLNIAPYANASFPNLGATGVIRDEGFKNVLSIALQNRVFKQSTIQAHRVNMTGKKLDQTIRDKMSASSGGVRVSVKDVNTGIVNIYRTKTEASKALNVSIRTLTR